MQFKILYCDFFSVDMPVNSCMIDFKLQKRRVVDTSVCIQTQTHTTHTYCSYPYRVRNLFHQTCSDTNG